MMHKVVWLSVVLSAVVIGGCVPADTPEVFEATKAFTAATPGDGVTTLSVDWRNGRVTLTLPSNGSTDIQATGQKVVGAQSQAAADAAVADIDVTLAPEAGDATTAVLAFTAPTSDDILYGGTATVTTTGDLTVRVANPGGDLVVDLSAASNPVVIDFVAGVGTLVN